MPARCLWQHGCNEGNDASAPSNNTSMTLSMMTVATLPRKAILPRTTTSPRRATLPRMEYWPSPPKMTSSKVSNFANEGNFDTKGTCDNNSAMCGQGRQHNAGKDTNSASAGPTEAMSPWNNARYSNEATGKDNDHDNNATLTDVSRLCLGWADASLQCWGQCQRNEGKEASATLVTTPVQRRQTRAGCVHGHQRDAGKDACATPA
jgi:hypothetical protein